MQAVLGHSGLAITDELSVETNAEDVADNCPATRKWLDFYLSTPSDPNKGISQTIFWVIAGQRHFITRIYTGFFD